MKDSRHQCIDERDLKIILHLRWMRCIQDEADLLLVCLKRFCCGDYQLIAHVMLVITQISRELPPIQRDLTPGQKVGIALQPEPRASMEKTLWSTISHSIRIELCDSVHCF